MRKKVVEAVALASALAAGGAGWGQQAPAQAPGAADAPPAKSRLEEVLAQALVVNAPARARGPIADKIRTALDRPVKLTISGASADEVFAAFEKINPDIHMLVLKGPRTSLKVTMKLDGMPFGAALQLLED